MKSFLAYLFILIFSFNILGTSLFVADYYIRTENYARLCVNKDQVQKHCNGKCQLEKQIKNHHKKQEKQQKNTEKREVLCYLPPALQLKNLPILFSVKIDKRINLYLSEYKASIFRPPCFITNER